MNLRVAKIVHDSVTDGPGLRAAVFFQGCPHRCAGCHNPELLTTEGGTEMTTEELLAEITENPLHTGVTFTGGEPMEQAEALLPAAKRLKESGYDLWIYTGCLWEELDGAKRELAEMADVVKDGPYIAEQKSLMLPWRGSANQRLIDVNKSLAAGEIMLYAVEKKENEYVQNTKRG
ncbi:MAG: anaerobic ribonucleoside-triphosphate reductase activating protein [Oscillospiraceae bacterium]|nr:anaerobic ribonucleoside-triphosphate reductase activating protein [Oscillospiraceae bacterium]